ncbi:MAG TPA: hypothetical protein VFM79_09055 [Pelobium sp.]|nr:hypothetical protein [Pelobium sp.]
MITVLKEFGFSSLGLMEEDFLKENYVTQLGYPPLRIDILNSISGVEFDEAFENRDEAEIDNLQVNFISLSRFIQNKKATGRSKDIGDIQSLE